MDLFRKEALEAAANSSTFGEIRLGSPGLAKYVAVCSFLFCAIAVIIISFGTYTRRVKATGLLTPASGLINVQAASQGVITDLKIHIGQVVQKGQVIAETSESSATKAYGLTSDSIATSMSGDIGRLEIQMREATKASNETIASLTNERRRDVEGLEAIREKISSAKRVKDNLDEIVQRIQPLTSKGYVSLIEELKAKNDAEAQLSALLQLEKDAATALSQVQQDEQKINDARHDASVKQAELQTQISSLKQSLVTNEAVGHRVILSPSDGTISSMPISKGQRVAAGQTISSIVPSETSLETVLLVPTSAIGFIREGLVVQLHYSAFPYEKFGVQTGRIYKVSSSTISPTDFSERFGASPPTDPMYIVYVRIPRQTISVYGKDVPLNAGTAVDADVLLDKRRIIEWIVEPLLASRENMHD